MTRIIIENVKDEFVPAFREFAEKMEANIKCVESSLEKGAESSVESRFEKCVESSIERENPYICEYGYSHIPNDETIRALEECERGEGEIVENFSAIEFHKQMLAELKNENGA